jgi:hypothetical protein
MREHRRPSNFRHPTARPARVGRSIVLVTLVSITGCGSIRDRQVIYPGENRPIAETRRDDGTRRKAPVLRIEEDDQPGDLPARLAE